MMMIQRQLPFPFPQNIMYPFLRANKVRTGCARHETPGGVFRSMGCCRHLCHTMRGGENRLLSKEIVYV